MTESNNDSIVVEVSPELKKKTTIEISICLGRVKIVQTNKLAVAHGVTLLLNDSSSNSGNSSTIGNSLGIKNDEPCHVFLRTSSDVNRLEKYMRTCLQAHGNDHQVMDSSSQVTKPWIHLPTTDGKRHICRIRTILTKAIERNRHGIKLIECQEILSIHHGGSIINSSNYTATWQQKESTSDTWTQKDTLQFKMHDKSERHALFAQWLLDRHGKDFLATGSGVLDVAGGKGELSKELRALGIPSIILDPAPRLVGPLSQHIPVLAYALEGDGTNLLHDEANTTTHEQTLIRSCSMIVGMHPDQATEPIIRLAKHLRVPFALLPCCVMPSLFPHRVYQGQPVRSYRVFCLYLQALETNKSKAEESQIQTDHLPFMGRNLILFSSNQNKTRETSENLIKFGSPG